MENRSISVTRENAKLRTCGTLPSGYLCSCRKLWSILCHELCHVNVIVCLNSAGVVTGNVEKWPPLSFPLLELIFLTLASYYPAFFDLPVQSVVLLIVIKIYLGSRSPPMKPRSPGGHTLVRHQFLPIFWPSTTALPPRRQPQQLGCYPLSGLSTPTGHWPCIAPFASGKPLKSGDNM